MSDVDTEQQDAVTAELRDGVQAAVDAGDRDALSTLVADLHESDTAELIGRLDPEGRVPFIRLLGDAFDYTALTELDEALRAEILAELEPKDVAEGLADLDSDDAVYILEDLPDAESEAILAELPFAMRHRLKRSLDYPEESAGRRMQTDFVAMPPFWTVGQVIDTLREEEDLPDHFTEIYVVDAAFKLMGTVKLDRLLRTRRPLKITDIMDDEPRTIEADE
ncbi:MAG: magnesium transporter, partial [Pseudomonadota bacterium]